MSKTGITQAQLIRGKLNSETARIPWKELQRYFAGGYTLLVDQQLDLIEVGYQFQLDNSARVAQWLEQELVAPVSNQQARQWINDDAVVGACVVKPWELIQPCE